MENKKINIFLAADDQYAQHLGVALESILSNIKNKNYNIQINILSSDISNINKNRIKKLCQKYNSDIFFFDIDNNIFKDFPEMRHLKIPTYYRLIINTLANNEDKIIYIDSDTVTLGDITELYEQDISGYPFGAIRELSENEVLKEKIFTGLKKYFNAGVMLINIQEWNKLKISENSIKFIQENPDKLKWADQDALNFTCAKYSWKELNNKFNFQVDRNQKKIKNKEICIIHFVGALKPWHYLSNSYYKKYYLKYLKMTPWKNYKYPDKNLQTIVKKLIKKIPLIKELRIYFLKKYHKLK